METGDKKINSGETMETVNANTTGNDEGGAMTKDMKTKNSGMLIGLIVLAIVALGGIGFGVWAMLDGNNQVADANKKVDVANQQVDELKKQNEELAGKLSEEKGPTEDEAIINIADNHIDNGLAQNLINPYIKMIGYYNNILNLGFSEDTKVYLAYRNLERELFGSGSGENPEVSYNEINSEYKNLFGSGENIEKKDYQAQNVKFLYKNRASDGYETFEVVSSGIGGAGTAMFDVVESARYDGENVIVGVYHDTVPTCGANENDGYCLNIEFPGGIVSSIDQYNMRDLIGNFVGRIPVYAMTFVKDSGHYVLSAVAKK